MEIPSNPLNQLRIYWKIQGEDPGCMTGDCALDTEVPRDAELMCLPCFPIVTDPLSQHYQLCFSYKPITLFKN